MAARNFTDFFARASAGWYFNSAGVLTQAAINEPRYDYDPLTVALRGLLIEEARTNLILNSGVFTSWNVQGSTLAPPSMAAPDGGLARKLVSSATSSTVCQAYFPAAPTAAGTSYSFSSYFKAGEYTAAYLNTNLTGGYLSAAFDLLTGNTKSSAGLTASMVAVGSGWWRCTVTGVAASTAAQVAVGGASNYAGANVGTGPATGSVFDGVAGLYIWGAQFEAGAFASSYIPTTSAQVTRSSDNCALPTGAAWFNATEGTLYAEVMTASATPTSQIFASLDDGTINNRLAIYKTAGVSNVKALARLASALQADLTAGAANGLQIVKSAFAFRGSDFALSTGGAAPVTTASGSMPPITAFVLGDGSGSGAKINGWLRDIRYYPRRLSNAELQALTL